jgi:glycosyltransferase involved in cell wall biosynthesis
MKSINQVTIIIPCYNEIKFLEIITQKVLNNKIENKQVIIIDDFSTDGTRELLLNKIEPMVDKVIYHERNMGKGACIRSAIKFIEGDIVIIQDADLEYDPSDHKNLVKVMEENNADVVYGSRVSKENKNNLSLYIANRVANFILTAITNFFTGLKITDMETGLKCFKKKAIENVSLCENGFGFEPEITIKLAKKKLKFEETGIKYNPRTISEGKKIRTVDGIIALLCILKYSIKS